MRTDASYKLHGHHFTRSAEQTSTAAPTSIHFPSRLFSYVWFQIAKVESFRGPFVSRLGAIRRFEIGLSCVQLVEQGLSLFQVARAEPFSEPAIDRSEKIPGLVPLALIAPQPRQACRRTQFPGFCLLRTRDSQSVAEIRFRFRRIRLRRQQCDFAGGPVDLGIRASLPGCFRLRHRFTSAAPSVITLAKRRVGPRQIR